MSWKYIMLEVKHEGATQQLPVIFPSNFVHADVYEAMCQANRRSARKLRIDWEDPTVISAGQIEGLTVQAVSGRSETLELNSIPGDTRVINAFQYMKGLK